MQTNILIGVLLAICLILLGLIVTYLFVKYKIKSHTKKQLEEFNNWKEDVYLKELENLNSNWKQVEAKAVLDEKSSLTYYLPTSYKSILIGQDGKTLDKIKDLINCEITVSNENFNPLNNKDFFYLNNNKNKSIKKSLFMSNVDEYSYIDIKKAVGLYFVYDPFTYFNQLIINFKIRINDEQRNKTIDHLIYGLKNGIHYSVLNFFTDFAYLSNSKDSGELDKNQKLFKLIEKTKSYQKAKNDALLQIRNVLRHGFNSKLLDTFFEHELNNETNPASNWLLNLNSNAIDFSYKNLNKQQVIDKAIHETKYKIALTISSFNQMNLHLAKLAFDEFFDSARKNNLNIEKNFIKIYEKAKEHYIGEISANTKLFLERYELNHLSQFGHLLTPLNYLNAYKIFDINALDFLKKQIDLLKSLFEFFSQSINDLTPLIYYLALNLINKFNLIEKDMAMDYKFPVKLTYIYEIVQFISTELKTKFSKFLVIFEQVGFDHKNLLDNNWNIKHFKLFKIGNTNLIIGLYKLKVKDQKTVKLAIENKLKLYLIEKNLITSNNKLLLANY